MPSRQLQEGAFERRQGGKSRLVSRPKSSPSLAPAIFLEPMEVSVKIKQALPAAAKALWSTSKVCLEAATYSPSGLQKKRTPLMSVQGSKQAARQLQQQRLVLALAGGKGGGGGSDDSSWTSTRSSDSSAARQEAAELAATELRLSIIGRLSDAATDAVVSSGSLTLSGLLPDGQPKAAVVPMLRSCGGGRGLPAGELHVEASLRRKGLVRRVSQSAASEGGCGAGRSGLQADSATGLSSMSSSASLPSRAESPRKPLLARLAFWRCGRRLAVAP